MTDSPEIAVVVPSHRAAETIGATLDGLMRQTLDPSRYEIHVVDSNADGTRAVIEERTRGWEGRVTYHEVGDQGPGGKRNFGAGQARAPYLAFTDADCVPEPEWLESGLSRLEQGASIVQGPTLTPNGSPPPPFSHAIHQTGPSLLYESCNVMFDTEAFRSEGGFSVDLFDETGSPLGEDTELAWAIRRAHGKAVFEPRAVVRHVVHPPDFGRHLRYEWQSRFFPRLVKRVPELRAEGLKGGVFLGRRSVIACAALAGLAVSSRSRWGYLLAAPYALELARVARAAEATADAPEAVAKQVLGDAVREAGLIWGSIRYRSLVL